MKSPFFSFKLMSLNHKPINRIVMFQSITNKIALNFNKKQSLKIYNNSIKYCELNPKLNKLIFTTDLRFSKINNLKIEFAFNKKLEYGGAFCFKLLSNEDLEYYRICFSFEEIIQNYWIIKIGEIVDNKNLTTEKKRNLQKKLMDIYPRKLMLFLIQALAQKLNIKEIYAVSNKIHVNNIKKNYIIYKEFLYDFDSFYKKLGFKIQQDYWVRIPLEFEKKDTTNLSPEISQLYLKKIELFNEFSLQLEKIMND